MMVHPVAGPLPGMDRGAVFCAGIEVAQADWEREQAAQREWAGLRALSGSGMAGRAAGAELAAGCADLGEVLDALAGIDVGQVPGELAGQSLLQLLRAARRVEGLAAALTARLAGSGTWASEGYRSVRDWVKGQDGQGLGPAAQVADLGRQVTGLPMMGAALTAGTITSRHVGVLARAIEDFPRLAGDLREAEASLADLAAACEAKVFAHHVTRLCHQLDPAAVERERRRRDAEHYLSVSTMTGGAVRVDGTLPADVGAQLVAALDAARRQVAMPDPEPGTGPGAGPGAGDARRTSQRNVEALGRVLAAAASATGPDGLPAVNGARPVVHLAIDLDTLCTDPHADAHADSQTQTDSHAESAGQRALRMGWLERFGVPAVPVTAAHARALACDAAIRPLLLGPDGQLAAYGTLGRAVPPGMRRHVTMRDRHCRYPGCGGRIDEIHHVRHWADGGPTTPANLVALCWWHHHHIHQPGHRLRLAPDGTLTGTRPNGATWITTPDPHAPG